MSLSIGERLKKARRLTGLTQKEFAKKAGMKSQGALSDLENGRNKTSTALYEIAKVAGVNYEWLAHGKGEMIVSQVRDVTVRQVPVLNYVQAGKWRDFFDNAVSNNFEPVIGDFGEYTYGLIIEGDSMTNEFNDSDIIIVDPDKQANAGDYVVAMIDTKQGQAVTFKKYRPRGFYDENKEYFELVALNEDYESYDSRFIDCRIIGVAVEHKRKLR